jgi:hypothetical protein
MKRGKVCKGFICFLSLSFLFLTSGFSGMNAEAKEKDIPIGEMVSKGNVRFEARENQWKNVEPSYFPIFQGIKIRTENGVAVVSFPNNSQVDLGPNSTVFFEQNNRLNLSQGSLDFRLSSASQTAIRVRSLSITLPRPLTASKGISGPFPSGDKQETIGSITVHPNGAVTVKSFRGSVSIIGQDRTVLATLSSKDMVTIPSGTSAGLLKLAQAGDDNDDKKDPAGGGASGGAAGGGAAGAGAGAAAGASYTALTTTAAAGLGLLLGGGGGLLGFTVYQNNNSQENCCCPKCPEPCSACR